MQGIEETANNTCSVLLNPFSGCDHSYDLDESVSSFKDCLPHLFHGFRNKYFNKILLDNMLYLHN